MTAPDPADARVRAVVALQEALVSGDADAIELAREQLRRLAVDADEGSSS